MVAEHLPILPVLIPLLAAPIAILVGRSSLAWLLSTSASIAAFFVAIGLLELTLANGAIRYALGGWSPPWGIEMRIDVASAFVLLAVSGISSLVLIYARASIEKEIKEGQHTLYYTAHLLSCVHHTPKHGEHTTQPKTQAGKCPRVRLAKATSDNMTGTSTKTPTTVAKAAPEFRPNTLMATATANSKKLDVPIMAHGAATACGTRQAHAAP